MSRLNPTPSQPKNVSSLRSRRKAAPALVSAKRPALSVNDILRDAYLQYCQDSVTFDALRDCLIDEEEAEEAAS